MAMTKIHNDKERSDLAIKRLRTSKDEETREKFRQQGRWWAMEKASYADLERLTRNTTADGCKTLDVVVASLDDPRRSLFGQFGGIGPTNPLLRRGINIFRSIVGHKRRPAIYGGSGPVDAAVIAVCPFSISVPALARYAAEGRDAAISVSKN
jgi:hypothetical protein